MSENKIIDGRTGELIGAGYAYSGSGVGNANSTYVNQGAQYANTGYTGGQTYSQNVAYGTTGGNYSVGTAVGNYAVGTTAQYAPTVTTSNYVAGGYSTGTGLVAGNQQVVNTTVNTGK
jgi:hypothetical protein